MSKLTAWRIPDVDVGEVRRGTGLSVEEFATRYGLTAASIRKWEAGISGPYKTARIVLAMIVSQPDALHQVLHAPKAGASSRFFRES